VVALRLGGADDITNWQLLCGPCNYRKNDHDMGWLHERNIYLGILPAPPQLFLNFG